MDGKIALAYPSDYGYAVDLNKCKYYRVDEYKDTACVSNNWMKTILGVSSNGWLLSTHSGGSYDVSFVHLNGSVSNFYLGAQLVYEVAPVLYLSSELGIELGDGSSSNPYKLSI